MSTVYTSGSFPFDDNGDLEVDLVQGREYIVGIGGNLGGGTAAFKFVDGSGNAVAVPAPGKFESTTDPLTFSEPGIAVIPALTARLVVTIAGATTPAATLTVAAKVIE